MLRPYTYIAEYMDGDHRVECIFPDCTPPTELETIRAIAADRFGVDPRDLEIRTPS